MTNPPSNGNEPRRARRVRSTVKLLSVIPELADFLRPEEREHAEQVGLPVVQLRGPVDIAKLLERANAFAALVTDGMLLRQMRIGEQPTLRLIGPGEIVTVGTAPGSGLVVQSDWRAVDGTRLAVLGIEFLASSHRWPRLVAGLQARTADGTERLATQLAICQLPRVQDRLLAMLWLLAESWGHVTPSGTTLSLSLTHETLGALVGARRPTVTLALRELAERGALVHQDRGWLLLEAPNGPVGSHTEIEAPRVLQSPPTQWSANGEPVPESGGTHRILHETLARLREDHLRNTEYYRTIIRQTSDTRQHNTDVRLRIRRQLSGEPGDGRDPGLPAG
jgi:CRP/FNR family cyclic AMP-dependent transcriptional regulator